MPGTVVPPLMVSTTNMPLPVVNAPAPPALVMRSSELPVAVPPLITRRSEGEPSVPRKVLRPSVPPVPR
jgi:hypothetical protein